MPATMTESPFDKRHCCWFCGEPNSMGFTFPTYQKTSLIVSQTPSSIVCPHPKLSVPSCEECYKIANGADVNSIWAVNDYVKRALMKRYRKHLAIGINWTPEELANSEFQQGSFAGFARSAWFMYEIARDRVNYNSWSLIIDGVELYDDRQKDTFNFDGVIYACVEEAIAHYSKTFFIDTNYFTAVLSKISEGEITSTNFAKTVRFCRLLVNSSALERNQAFEQLEV